MLATASVRGVSGLVRYALTNLLPTPRPRHSGETTTRAIRRTLDVHQAGEHFLEIRVGTAKKVPRGAGVVDDRTERTVQLMGK